MQNSLALVGIGVTLLGARKIVSRNSKVASKSPSKNDRIGEKN
jgi:hypothetical protein